MELKALLNASYKQIFFAFAAFRAMVIESNFYVSGIVQMQRQSIRCGIIDTRLMSVAANIPETKLRFSSVVHGIERLLTTAKIDAKRVEFLKVTNTSCKAPRSRLPDCMEIYAHIDGEYQSHKNLSIKFHTFAEDIGC